MATGRTHRGKEHLDSLLQSDEISRLLRLGRAESAIGVAQDALDRVLEADDEDLAGRALANLGTTHIVAGRGQEAESPLIEGLGVFSDPYVRFRLAQTLVLLYDYQQTQM